MDKVQVDAWLARYVAAWKSDDPAAIGALFSVDCVHRYTPFDAPQIGRDAIVASWLDSPDPRGTYDAEYRTLMIDGERAVTTGTTWYFAAPDSREVTAEFANIWVLRFNPQGECSEFLEWYFAREGL